jgi:hypothetical protein
LRELLEILFGEDVFNLSIEISISDVGWVFTITEMVFKKLVLLSCQLQFLSIESSSEFGGLKVSLSKRIVILEEFSKSDSMSCNVFFDSLH